MAFSKARRNALHGGGGGHGDDFMITPLLDLFVALIPFLVLGAVLTRINIVDVGVSKPVQSLAQPKPNKFDLNLTVSKSKAELKFNGATAWSGVTDEKGQWVKNMRAKLVEIKKKNLEELKIRVEPSGDLPLEHMMLVMDGIRSLRPEDGELSRIEGDKKVKLKYLFPQITLKGVY